MNIIANPLKRVFCRQPVKNIEASISFASDNLQQAAQYAGYLARLAGNPISEPKNKARLLKNNEKNYLNLK